MDEPLSNLDAKLRVQMRAEIAKLQNDLGTTTVYVTHDQVEAMTMGDRVAVMRKGELQQVDAPQELYDRPVNLFVGGFIGSPAMNMIEATLERSNGGLAAAARKPEDRARRARRSRPGRRCRATRARTSSSASGPEDLEDAELEPDTPAEPAPARRGRAARGARLRDHGPLPHRRDGRRDRRDARAPAGRRSGRASQPQAEGEGATLVGRFGARSRVETGKPVEIAVDTRALHFFDPETGLGIYDAETRKGAGS